MTEPASGETVEKEPEAALPKPNHEHEPTSAATSAEPAATTNGDPHPRADGAPAPAPVDEPAPPDPEDIEDSPLSQRLGNAPTEAKVELAPEAARTQLAKKRIGATLKGYRLTKLLGVGTATATFEAVKGAGDAGERVVARMLLGDVAKSERAKSHFLRAGYAASRFSHPRTVPVSADGVDEEGATFTLRPYHEAEPVSRFVKTNEPDEQRVLKVAEQLLDILEIAHAHGIVHGAITPENVLLTSRGSARLVDFSVPPGLGSRRDDESPLPALRLGPFTPPERCKKPEESSATEQSDIWSVGAVMYFALAGAPPRGGAASLDELASATAKPIRDVRKEVSEPIASVIDHALSADPSLRYDSAYAMLGDVRRVLAGRKPKLAQSTGPVPSGVLADSSGGPPSTFRPPPFRTSTTGPSSQRGKGPSQWRGNVTLVVLIAALLAAATYVMLREKSEEVPGTPAPSSS